MKYDIYFHDDFDGRASAAMVLAFLHERGHDFGNYFAMNYGSEDKWLKSNLLKKKNPAVIVDFLYHPGAAWWFDHHASTFRNKKWEENFRPDKQHRLAPKYLSCCHLVYDSLRANFGWNPPRHLRELAEWLDVVDGATYKTAKMTVEAKEPALAINNFIEHAPHTNKENKRFIELLAAKPLRDVAKAPGMAGALKDIKKKIDKSLEFYKKNIQIEGNISFINLNGDVLNGLLRYAPFYLYPETLFGGRIKKAGKSGKAWYLRIGANPWNRKRNRFDLGKIMRDRFGGGGHKNIGAVDFKTEREAVNAFNEVAALLNK